MTIWIDAQLSPAIAFWIESNFNVKASALRDLDLRDAEDEKNFHRRQKLKRRCDD
jgi:predicted nuclease of predicted toxin-antitoxin system